MYSIPDSCCQTARDYDTFLATFQYKVNFYFDSCDYHESTTSLSLRHRKKKALGDIPPPPPPPLMGPSSNNNEKKSSDYSHAKSVFRSSFWTLIIMASVVSGGFFLHNNTSEFLHSTVQTTLDGSVPLSEVFFPSVVVCNINQIRKSFFAELGFYENDTLVRIMYEDFIKGTMDSDWEASEVTYDPKRDAFYEVSEAFKELSS